MAYPHSFISFTRRSKEIFFTVLRLIYGGFFALIIFGPPPPSHPEAAAQAFWSAIEATGFMVPLLGACYFLGGVAVLWRRTAPLGLALLSPPMVIIVLFDALLVKTAGPWIPIALAHFVLLWHFRAAFAPLWSYRHTKAV